MNEEQLNQSTMLSDISQKKRIRQNYFPHSLKKDVLEPLRDDAMYSSSVISSKSDALKDESTGNKQDRDENKLNHNYYIRDPGRQRKHTYATDNVARGIAESVPEVHFIGEIVGAFLSITHLLFLASLLLNGENVGRFLKENIMVRHSFHASTKVIKVCGITRLISILHLQMSRVGHVF